MHGCDCHELGWVGALRSPLRHAAGRKHRAIRVTTEVASDKLRSVLQILFALGSHSLFLEALSQLTAWSTALHPAQLSHRFKESLGRVSLTCPLLQR